MTETKFWPCDHIEIGEKGFFVEVAYHPMNEKGKLHSILEIDPKIFWCQYCGAKRPEEVNDAVTELAEVFKTIIVRHYQKYKSAEEWREGIKNDLAKAAIDWFVGKMPPRQKSIGSLEGYRVGYYEGFNFYRTELLKILGRGDDPA